MTSELKYPSDVAFTPTVKAIQQRKGSRTSYERMEAGRGWSTMITSDLADFIAAQTSVFFGTASADGQPYIQHRGGPPGFLRVLDGRTLAFADYRGNRQYISQGNLADNPKACLFLIDYVNRRRIKIWGEARVVEDDPQLLRSLMPEDYEARPEQAFIFTVSAWDSNCPQHIPQRFEAADVAAALEERDRRIEELTRRLADLEAAGGARSPGGVVGLSRLRSKGRGGSDRSGGGGRRRPGAIGVGSKEAQGLPVDQVSLDVEVVPDGSVGRQKPLG